MKFEIDTNPSESDDQFIVDEIINFNVQILKERSTHFTIFAKENNTIIAGASIWEQSDALYIKHLWVDEKFREQGVGSTLLKMTDDYANEKKLKCIHVDTYSFQAQDFYTKHGFMVIATIKNYLLGHDRIFLKKTIQ